MASYGANAGAQQRRGGSRSLFYRDMSLEKGGFRSGSTQSSSGGLFQGAQSSIWRENAGAADPPPPPCFTLEDRTPTESMLSPPAAGEFRSPETPAVRYPEGKSPLKTPLSGASSVGRSGGLFGDFQSPVAPPGAASSPSWWSTPTGPEMDRENHALLHQNLSQHHEQQQHQSGLLTLPAPRQIIRPEVQRNGVLDEGEEGDEWVTVYGFQGEDTNGVLREFEKCGPIVRHVPGPSTSNWLHIQYQSRQDAQKALRKNGMQLYGALIIGVKPLDPMQRQALVDKPPKPSIGFAAPASKPGSKGQASVQASPRPYYLQPSGDSGARQASAIASPTKSILSKVVDLVFGF